MVQRLSAVETWLPWVAMSDATILPDNAEAPASNAASEPAERIFSTSVVISGIRCLLTYLVFPFVAPIVGITSNTGAVIGVLLGLVAVVFNVLSIRRFFASKHPYRWWASAMNVAVIVLLVVLFVVDSQTLLG